MHKDVLYCIYVLQLSIVDAERVSEFCKEFHATLRHNHFDSFLFVYVR